MEKKPVPYDHKFFFPKKCPYCGGDLTYTATSWEKNDNEEWEADGFDSECSSEPDDIMSEEWSEWLRKHSDMPYVHQLPVDEEVKAIINKEYTFVDDENN